MVEFGENAIERWLTERLSSARWAHTVGVAETAAALASRFGSDPGRARLAGLLHDCAREIPATGLLIMAEERGLAIDPLEREEPLLLHGKIGAALAREVFSLRDPEVLEAVAAHITGEPGMSALAKVVFLADFIEPGRKTTAARRVREAVPFGLDRALLAAFDAVIVYVVSRGYLLHPRTVAARNELLLKNPG